MSYLFLWSIFSLGVKRLGRAGITNSVSFGDSYSLQMELEKPVKETHVVPFLRTCLFIWLCWAVFAAEGFSVLWCVGSYSKGFVGELVPGSTGFCGRGA